jgi:retron-type reverse transcriptase
LNKCNCLYSLQFGFRKNHSTTDAIINNIEYIQKSLDSGSFVCGIFIDLQKAFDTVDHDILFSKLTHYGVREVVLD